MQEQTSLSARLSPWAVRAAALWVLAVSAIKAYGGSPNDIPQFLQRLVGPELSFFGSISIEFAIAAAALARPQIGWLPLSLLMSVFVGVLLHLISIGATSCGCFGGAIKLSPYVMLAIDGTLFAALLATRPWRALRGGRVPTTVVALLAAAGAALPWLVIHNEEYTAPALAPVMHVSEAQPDVPAAAPEEADASAPAERPNSSDGNLVRREDESGRWALPSKLPRWARLEPPSWVGKSIHETELAIWLDTRLYPEDATWILYLETCSHCRDYLQKLDEQFGADPKVYVLVRLSTPNDEAEGIVQIKPPGEIAALPSEVAWNMWPEPAPWELVLEGGVVKSATHHGD